ncbi:MAG: Unknown protein [uncultured Sulfurovum sp.]|uniref:Uncharacterized protein n=1 Tax=uncultured Sulfurovum sp. TaxID=269237 RepID=A0A6S6T9W9_9BACT|nr:MAG: Unknown protein [uncultured Sulfurovum sp.]
MAVIKKNITMEKGSNNLKFEQIKREVEYNKRNYLLFSIIFVIGAILGTYLKSMPFFLIVLSSLLLFYWENINIFFSNFKYTMDKTNFKFYIPYIYDNNKKLYNVRVDGISLAKEVKVFSKGKSYIFTASEELSNEYKHYIVEILNFKDIFYDSNRLNIFFTMSVLIINILYMLIMLSLYVNKDSSVFLSKEVLIILCTVVFFITIIFILGKVNPVSKNLTKYLDDNKLSSILDKVTIHKSIDGNLSEVTMTEVKTFFDETIKTINDRKAQVLQISTPIFYLAQMTILVSYQ